MARCQGLWDSEFMAEMQLALLGPAAVSISVNSFTIHRPQVFVDTLTSGLYRPYRAGRSPVEPGSSWPQILCVVEIVMLLFTLISA